MINSFNSLKYKNKLQKLYKIFLYKKYVSIYFTEIFPMKPMKISLQNKFPILNINDVNCFLPLEDKVKNKNYDYADKTTYLQK